ncbi:MAG TPA: hypothetical protein VKU19_41750 [Bryobacteraceae bacterium]|nr:hypothetical protein [Bryobacteraceae bacterium]
MGSISSVPNGMSYVAAALGASATGVANATGDSTEFAKLLETASPQDAVALSSAALQLQQINGILGLSSSNSTENLFLPPEPADDNTMADQLAQIATQAQTSAARNTAYGQTPAQSGSLNVLA